MHDIEAISRQFDIPGRFIRATPLGHGHIHDTFLAEYAPASCFTHQRINTAIFRDPDGLMMNIERISGHIRAKLVGEAANDMERRVLTPVRSRDGGWLARDASGGVWRTYHYIERARTYNLVQRPRQAGAAARAFAEFQWRLSDLPADAITETLPDFHNTPVRFVRFNQALADDRANRTRGARAEIAWAQQQADWIGALVDLQRRGELPTRITHNDTKLNNVLFDESSDEPLCVIDLDTVMPGLALYDFGDLVRTAACPAAEDERDLALVSIREDYYRAIAEGYLDVASRFLTATEIDHLTFAAQLITFETGLRFLTDHLDGDTYFKTHRPGHNLDRARNQFALTRDLMQRHEELQQIVDACR